MSTEIYIPMKERINNPSSLYLPLDPSVENPIIYRGWRIWKWTGWNGHWARRNPNLMQPHFCTICHKRIKPNDLVYIAQEIEGAAHADCRPEYNGEIFGQWLAISHSDFRHPDCKYIYANAPGGGGLYNRGGSFDIRTDNLVTYYTDPEILIKMRNEALGRLKVFIDQEVDCVNI